jgi:ferredoxin--NADP+ reductase/benzoate/toluate 1,2-dioxygenase reductase subunit
VESTALHILEHLPVGTDAYLLRLERPDWEWEAGQLVSLTGKEKYDQRDYTICSGTQDSSLDVLYRLIPHGLLTPFLVQLQAGDSVEVQGPYGRFTVQDPARPLLFCATGTGVAPFRAFHRSHPGLSCSLYHGVRVPDDLYFREEFGGVEYYPFCSREPLDGVCSRLTDALRHAPLPEGVQVYLCGANEMIYEAEEILQERGVPSEDLFHEPYYYRAYDAEEDEVKKHSE